MSEAWSGLTGGSPCGVGLSVVGAIEMCADGNGSLDLVRTLRHVVR